MKLNELLEKQEQLNEAIGSYPETPEQLAMAIAEECGEVSKELRADWRWWTWEGQTHELDRVKLIEELNDVLKFVLVGLIAFSEPDELETARKYWQRDWSSYGLESLSYSLGEIVQAFPDEMGWNAIAELTRICAKLNVTRDELEAAYLAKWEKNMKRTGAIA